MLGKAFSCEYASDSAPDELGATPFTVITGFTGIVNATVGPGCGAPPFTEIEVIPENDAGATIWKYGAPLFDTQIPSEAGHKK